MQGIKDSTIESAIAGDRESLNLLWQQSRRWVGAILLAHKPRDADLEDLLQVVAMQVCRNISKVREPRAFKSWVRTIAINTAREEGRKTIRRKRSMLRLVGMEQVEQKHTIAPDELYEESAESRRIYAAAMSLPMGYREPVLLRCLRSMSYQQIGEVLGLPSTTIETRIARGRRMLKEILKEQETQRDEASAKRVLGGAR